MSDKQSLYNKYRPNNFEEVIGQKVAKSILKNSISKNKINHAYLFYGIRGTGKTTLARIFAKAVNCSNTVDSNPCNECEICKSINNGSAFDIIEIDAASNNGVDEIRIIKENTSYLTTLSKYKVYIIDEVHMLTKQAFNALLKTLEEPPRNTIFLLATTEIQKIPQTVLSRSIIVNLEVMSDEDITTGLKVVCDGEKIIYEQESLKYITMISGGSLRDGISFLEATLLYNEKLNVNNVIEALGLIKSSEIKRMILNDYNELINEIDKSNKDPRKISLLILEELMILIKEGKTQYIKLLNSIIHYTNTIKDPLLLKVALKSVFYNMNVSHETKYLLEKNVENSKNNKKIENNTNIIKEKNENTSLKNVENSHLEKKEKSLNIITDYANVNNYIYIIKNNNKEELKKYQDRWKYIEKHTTSSKYKKIISVLFRTTPLALTKKTIILGFYNENQISEFKTISLDKEFFEFVKEIIGEYKFILPINEETWSKLSLVSKGIETTDLHKDLTIEIKDFLETEFEKNKNKLNDLFGEGNITHE